jgi:hypothetical protein
MTNPKHLKFVYSYTDFLNEQAVDEEGMPLPEPVETKFRYAFLKKGQEGSKKYPDGSSSTIFDTFEIKENDLKLWLEQNVTNLEGTDLNDNEASVKRKTLYDYFSGKKNNVQDADQPYIKRFKTATETELIAKRVDDTEVYFAKKTKVPTTEMVDVTFITTK